MSYTFWMRLARRAGLAAVAVLFTCYVASAQSTAPQDQASPGQASSDQASATSYSSSQSGTTQVAELALPEAPAPEPSAAASGQYGSGGGSGEKHGLMHNRSWTFEVNGGFNAPIGNDTNEPGVVTGEKLPVITWGGNFGVGGGLRFNNRLSVLAEYQFIDDKLPGALITAVNTAVDGGADDITAGNTHINSITGSPVIDLTPKWTNGFYLVGGFGWYHKSTNFQAAEEVFDPYYGYYAENVTVSSFTSNQWGGNGGLGFYHRLGGGMYGNDTSQTQLFAEVRYLFIHTPPATQDNGLGTTELIPISLGVRF